MGLDESGHPERWAAPDLRICPSPPWGSGILSPVALYAAAPLAWPRSGATKASPGWTVGGQGGLGEEWSRVSMATRKTGTLCPTPHMADHQVPTSLSSASLYLRSSRLPPECPCLDFLLPRTPLPSLPLSGLPAQTQAQVSASPGARQAAQTDSVPSLTAICASVRKDVHFCKKY